ncbi:4-phosphopantetheinyl transferase [Microbacterium sp. Au-Mic1]|uniref:4'-phosphopantetheinyl transferase family protein n=1 Tax=Microbacterium sp. Au-Mic1 TaxID=2906457 RepID=UPI001E3C63E8|nr:4-phosphopantetheinyl transferase [Microbacterium sp. Au-Mic1]MCE4025888.1 4-phosphopantetheinyl transferase [Microbacterium sp. Au-Mic1]
MQRTTIEGVRIAWARSASDVRRETAHALIRSLAAELAPGSDLRIVRRCVQCGGPHGRPLLPDAPLHASIAYAEPWVVVAVTREQDSAAIGIDAEHAGTMPALRALFAPADPPDLRGWTAIEAALKADGRGLALPPDQVRFTPDGFATVPGGGDFRILPVDVDPELIVTLARRPPDSGPRPTPRR